MSDGDKFVNKAGATATSDKLDLAGGEFVNEAGDTSGIALTQIGENGQFTANGDTTLQQVGSAGGPSISTKAISILPNWMPRIPFTTRQPETSRPIKVSLKIRL